LLAFVAARWFLAGASDVTDLAAVGADDGGAFYPLMVWVTAVVALLGLALLRAVFADVTSFSAGVALLHELLARRSDLTDLDCGVLACLDDEHAAEEALVFIAKVSLVVVVEGGFVSHGDGLEELEAG
jgi:hypothetical protein